MFTGLIETTGTLLAVTPTAGATRITIASPTLTARLNTGDSIAVNGVCLTALSIEPQRVPAALLCRPRRRDHRPHDALAAAPRHHR